MSDFDDFCGKHILNFDSINHQIVDGIVMMLETGASYSDILEWGGNSTDQLVHSACYAFSKGRLTREQMATLLELREIRNGFSMVQEHRLLDNHKQPFEQALQLLTSVLSRAEQETFLTLLTSKPQSEWCYFTFTIDPIELQNPKINALLEIAVNTHVIFNSTATLIQRHEFSEAKEDESSGQPKQNITILSVGCRDALNRSRYGEHAKALFPRIGVFTKDDIEFSMRNRGRYSAVSYPGIENSTQFHSVEARPFYLAVHDEIHRYFISTIPNKIYDALLYSVDVVRENIALPASPESSKTWSKGIWDCIDMEVSTFVGYTQDQRNNTSLELINQDFIALLSARIFSTNRVGGLFAPSPYIDTTWLLLIDMILNPEAWYKRSIDPTLFPINSMYKQMYDFIVSNKYRIDTTHSSATQVAILKSKYFDLPCSLENEMVFKKCKKNYLQVMVENIPIKLGKSVFLNLDSEPNNSQVLMDFIKDHRELIKITTNRVSFIGLVEKLSLISRDLLEKLLSDDILFSQVIDTSFDLIKVADQFVD